MSRLFTFSNPSVFGTYREESRWGRDWLVVKGVPIVEGVLKRYFVPMDEFAAFSHDWNGVPLVLRHPQTNGGIAKDPDVDVPVIGTFYRASLDKNNRRLTGEFWLDKVALMQSDEGMKIYHAIISNKMIEVSTGYHAGVQEVGGEHRGRTFVGIHRNLHPDHIAILPDITGACSIEDGCGLNRNDSDEGCGCQHTAVQNVEADAPDSMKKLWEKVYQASLGDGDSKTVASKKAWAACKRAGWEKDDDGSWVKNEEDDMFVHGGKGSGHWGHKGRGKRGGSAPGPGGNNPKAGVLRKGTQKEPEDSDFRAEGFTKMKGQQIAGKQVFLESLMQDKKGNDQEALIWVGGRETGFSFGSVMIEDDKTWSYNIWGKEDNPEIPWKGGYFPIGADSKEEAVRQAVGRMRRQEDKMRQLLLRDREEWLMDSSGDQGAADSDQRVSVTRTITKEIKTMNRKLLEALLKKAGYSVVFNGDEDDDVELSLTPITPTQNDQSPALPEELVTLNSFIQEIGGVSALREQLATNAAAVTDLRESLGNDIKTLITEVRGRMDTVRNQEEAEKATLAKVITQNTSAFTAEELQAMSLPMLEKMASAFNVDVDYALLGGVNTNSEDDGFFLPPAVLTAPVEKNGGK